MKETNIDTKKVVGTPVYDDSWIQEIGSENPTESVMNALAGCFLSKEGTYLITSIDPQSETQSEENEGPKMGR